MSVSTAFCKGRLLLIVLLGAFALQGCNWLRHSERAHQWPNTPVVLISVDTLRADHLSVYGQTSLPTPAIEGLARDGVVFERAFSHVPLTLPSHLSVLTGLQPHRHGVRSNAGYAVELDGLPYLPRLLSHRGYVTGAAISAFPLSRTAGFGADFHFFDDASGFSEARRTGVFQRSGRQTLEAVLPWLQKTSKSNKPFFLFFHIFEPHYPYQAPAAFQKPGRSAYESEVVAADYLVGLLVEQLKSLQVYDRALVMLISDHGEGLGDHGESGHGMLLHREVLQVPWILKLPHGEQAGYRVSAPAALTDVMPTVLDAVGVETAAQMDGRSQLPQVYGRVSDEPRAIVAETLFPRIEMGWSELKSIVRADLHLIEGPKPELYDWSRDPNELQDVSSDRRREAASLRQLLDEQGLDLELPQETSQESRAALEALGYVGSAGGSVDSKISPKDRIHIYEDFQAGRRALLNEDWPSALRHLHRAWAADPDLVDALLLLGRGLRLSGDLEGALEVFSQADGSGRAWEIATEVVEIHQQLGRLSVAPSRVARFIEAQPTDPRLRCLMADTLRRLGDLESALQAAETAVELSPDLDSRFIRATVFAAMGRKQEAIDDLRWVVEVSQDKHVGAMVDLAVLLREQGDEEEARRLLQLANFVDPESPSVHTANEILGL